MLQESLNNLKNATLQGGGLSAKFQNQPSVGFNDEGGLLQRQGANYGGIPGTNQNFSSPYSKIPQIAQYEPDFSGAHPEGAASGMLAMQQAAQAQQQQLFNQQRAAALGNLGGGGQNTSDL